MKPDSEFYRQMKELYEGKAKFHREKAEELRQANHVVSKPISFVETKRTQKKEVTMETGMQYVNGFVWGLGLLTAAIVFKVLFHTGLCG